MKKIAMLSFGILFSTVMFAGVGTENPNAVSTISVNKEGENTYTLKYKAVKAMNVSISILNEDGETVYMETIKNTNGFIRPYNFLELDKGVYTMEIADQAGVYKELVELGKAKIINIIKLSGEGRYLVSATGEGKEVIAVDIYDALGHRIHRDVKSTDGNFGQKYKLDNITGPVKFEVTSENGAIKTAKY